MKKQLSLHLLGSLILLLTLAGCGIPELPPSPVAEATTALSPTPTVTPSPTFTPSPTPTVTPSPTATPTLTPTATPTPQVQATVVSQSQVGTTIPPAATPTPAKLLLIITEDQANKMATEALAQQQDVQIDNPNVDFRPGEIYASGDTILGFFKLTIGVLATIDVTDGQPQIIIQEIYVNGDRATGFIRNQIEAMIAPHLDQLVAVSQDFYVEDVTITDDRMIITGHAR